MPPTLNQNEVDALMDAMEDGRLETEEPPGTEMADEATAGAEPFDLTSRDRIIRGRMPTLDIIHGRLARRLAVVLTDLVQEEIDVLVEPAAPMKLGEFLAYQSEPACINLVSCAPLLGTGLVCIQPEMFFTLVHIILGGERPEQLIPLEIAGRDYTPIEIEFARTLLNAWAQAAAESWREFHSIEPQYLYTEMSPDHVAIGAASDVMMATAFTLRLGELEGRLDVAIPYAMLEPIKHLLLEHHTEESEADRREWRRRVRTALSRAPLRVAVEFGRASFNLQDLLALRAGDVIRLDRHPDSPLPLRLAGLPKAWVRPIECNGNMAFQFDEWRTHER